MQASSIQDRSSGFYLQELRRHRGCTAFLAIVAFGLAFDAVRRDVVQRTVLYAFAIGLAVLIIDWTPRRKPRLVDPVPVRAPKVEIALLCANTLVAFAFLWLRFWAGFQPDSACVRLLFFGVGLGALFNVFLFPVLLGLGTGHQRSACARTASVLRYWSLSSSAH